MKPIGYNAQTRRSFLGRASQGLSAVALSSLLAPNVATAAPSLGIFAAGTPLPQKAKRVIWLTMAGGPSQLETFDPKPKLGELHGQPMPESLTKGQQLAQLQGQKLTCFAPQHPFTAFGKNNIEICSLFPQIGSVIDDICFIRSMTTDAINHDPAHMFMNTGSQIAGRPSMGSWVTYGLGAQSSDLPGFVVLTSLGRGGQNQPIAGRQWSSGFLPSRYQGVQLRSKGDPVLYLTSPGGISKDQQNADIAAINQLNGHHAELVDDPEIATRIAQYEMAFQMQASVPDLMDVKNETNETLDLYGCKPGDGSFAANCLLARRLAERGVRFIQLYHKDWDHHGGVKDGVALKAEEIDRACMALITDLKQRGMFEETLIVWAGEFGRTPMSQGGSGRDHHNKAMTVWLAGAGIRGGMVHGATDELGYAATENVCTVHDLHATMLNQLGIRHDAFSVKFQGLDAKLTGVEGAKVITDILT
ncbi:MAG TPA: sulfatase [Planctomycetaceae bacterium]|nr:sulfatase [Planctomycetaceae bacterium]